MASGPVYLSLEASSSSGSGSSSEGEDGEERWVRGGSSTKKLSWPAKKLFGVRAQLTPTLFKGIRDA